MPNTIMDRFRDEQARIKQRKDEAAAGYAQLFSNSIAQWNSAAAQDQAWLIYSANYLLRTGGVRWAIDPVTMRWRVPEMPELDIDHAFEQLDFVLLTHSHADHLDFDFLRALRHLCIRWVVPEYLLPIVQDEATLPLNQVIIPQPGQPFTIKDVRIIPFEGQHFEKSAADGTILHGVPAMGYLAEFGGKRWLFPGDTRSYRSGLPPWLGAVDGAFAHVWLGRGSAMLAEPPLIADFCRFCSNLGAKRVALTHLEEFGREAADFWDDRHVRQVISRLGEIAPQLDAAAYYPGECVSL